MAKAFTMCQLGMCPIFTVVAVEIVVKQDWDFVMESANFHASKAANVAQS